MVEPTFKITLWGSPDWRYLAPKWREQSSLRPFVEEVSSRFPHDQHLLLNKETKKRIRENQHCAAVRCFSYATHYQFKVDVQAFGLVREPPRYLHISKVDRNGLVSQDSQFELQGNSGDDEGTNPGIFVTVDPSFVRVVSPVVNFPRLW